MKSFELNRQLIPDNTRAILLDWDDTVVGTMDAKVRQHIRVAKEHYGIDLTREEMLHDWGLPLHTLIKKWYQIPAGDEKGLQEVFDTVISYSKDFPKRPIDGAMEAVDAIKSNDIPLGVVTGSPRIDLQHDFRALGIGEDYFDYFQSSDDSQHHKPDPRVFDPALEWLDKLDIKPSETLYGGDTLNDMYASVGAGFMFIGLETGADNGESFRQAGAISVKSLASFISARRIASGR